MVKKMDDDEMTDNDDISDELDKKTFNDKPIRKKLLFAPEFISPVKFAFVDLEEGMVKKYKKLIENNGGIVEPCGDYENVMHLTSRYSSLNSEHTTFDIVYLKNCIKAGRILDPCLYALRKIQSKPMCKCSNWRHTQEQLHRIAMDITRNCESTEPSVNNGGLSSALDETSRTIIIQGLKKYLMNFCALIFSAIYRVNKYL